MKRLLIVGAVALTFLALAAPSPGRASAGQASAGQNNEVVNKEAVDVARVIRAFTQKETEFRRALNGYTFKRDALVQTIGAGDQVTGEYERVSQFAFNDAGERFERITFFPQPTLTEVSFTNEDLEDLGGVQPFALEASKLGQYDFTYVGTEKVDELNTYVFDVAPKFVPKKVSERFFEGRIWVDQQDSQIVKTRGKGVPEGKQRFPVFETYREQIDGKYWFPTYTYADDQLVFNGGTIVHFRMRITFTDYERFRARVRILSDDVADQSEQQQKPAPTPTPTPQKKPPM